jgi:DegV family protein with EDD domain
MTEKAITAAAEMADHVIILTAPATLSGINNAMRLGASKLPPERVTLIDSGSTSMALGYQVQVGAEVAAATGDLPATLAAIQAVREHTVLYAALNTLEFLRASGRVNWAVAGIGALLQIKPIIAVKDGLVPSVARVRTFNRAIDELVELTAALAPLDRLTIVHTNAPDTVPQLVERLGSLIPADHRIISVTPTLGTHVGPGAVGVVPLSKSWRQ